MKIESWNPERHLPLLRKWLESSGHTAGAGPSEFYPDTGLVVDDCAAAFLYLTNAKQVAYLDGLVTNPKVPAPRRRLAVQRLCGELLIEADLLGVTLLWCSTPVEGLDATLTENGFVTLPGTYRAYARSRICPQPQ